MVQIATADVVLLHWPEEADRRAECQRAGVPVLLLVEPGGIPPFDPGTLEDWARTNADSIEIHARVTALSSKARQQHEDPPMLDENGVLHVGKRWIGLSPIDARLTNVLLQHLDHLVETHDLEVAGWAARPASNVLRVRLLRLRRALEPLGLTIRNVRNQGYVLETVAHQAA
jgi:DNA-binding response OmpR family regulator